MKLEEELVVQHHWEERVGGQSEGRVGAAPGETLGQRVVGGASMCQVVGSQEKDEGERPQVSEAPVRKGTGWKCREEPA